MAQPTLPAGDAVPLIWTRLPLQKLATPLQSRVVLVDLMGSDLRNRDAFLDLFKIVLHMIRVDFFDLECLAPFIKNRIRRPETYSVVYHGRASDAAPLGDEDSRRYRKLKSRILVYPGNHLVFSLSERLPRKVGSLLQHD